MKTMKIKAEWNKMTCSIWQISSKYNLICSLVLILNDIDKLDKSFLLTYMCDHLSDEYNKCLFTISGFQFHLYLPKAINESRTLYNQFFHHYYSSLHKGKTIHEDTQKIALICKANINLYSVSHVPIEYWKK